MWGLGEGYGGVGHDSTLTSTQQAPGLVPGSYILDLARLHIHCQQGHTAPPLRCEQHELISTCSMHADISDQ